MALLDGKVAIVTGAGAGIGRAEATLFAREGARVVVVDTGVARDGSGGDPSVAAAVVVELRALGAEAIAVCEPVHTKAGAKAIVAAALDAFGRVDVLVNNAGIVRDRSLGKLDLEAWQAVIDVQLTGAFLCTQEAVRAMLAGGEGGRVINTTAVAGLLGNMGQANYAAATAGVYGLTRTSAIELQKHRVFVNAIAPIAKTRMTSDLPMFEHTDSLSPEHVAPLALFLASPLAKDRTGYVMAVSGAQMYAFKLVQSAGKFKDGDGVWTAQEIADHFEAIVKT